MSTHKIEINSNKGGLSDTIVTELLRDINQRGGLHRFNLSALIKDKPDTYYTDESAKRAIQNKVNKFKRNPFHYHNEQNRLVGFVLDPIKNPSSAAPSTQELSSLFGTLSMTDQFGRVPYDFAIDIDPRQPWGNREVFVLKTPAVEVGVNPTLCTDVYTITPSHGVDIRFLRATNFQPYKLTQVGQKELVYEEPISTYDFVVGTQGSFVLSQNSQEQNEYKIARNKVGDDPKKWTTKYLLKFPDPVNYQIIMPENSRGEVAAEFCGQLQSISVKWRIAVVPMEEEMRVLHEQKPNPGAMAAALEQYLVQNGMK